MASPAERRTTPRPPADNSRAVRVWGEMGLTVSVGEYNMVKPTFGHERWSPSDSPRDLNATARAIHEFNAEQVDRMAKQAARLVSIYLGEEDDEEEEETPEERAKSKRRARRVVEQVEEAESPVKRRRRTR